MYTSEDSEMMLDGSHPDFVRSVHDEVTGHGRWHAHRFEVFERHDGTFWGVLWADAATEMQESQIDDPPFEVEAHEVVAIEWRGKAKP